MRSWVWLAEVLAENVMNSGMKSFGMLFVSLSAIASVLPVPVGPIHNNYRITKHKLIRYMQTSACNPITPTVAIWVQL